MPPKKILKMVLQLDDAVDGVYKDSLSYNLSNTSHLTENVIKPIWNVNYKWEVHYTVVRDNDSMGIKVFVEFNSRYTFTDKVYMKITAEVEGKTIVKKFNLEKKREQTFEINLIESDADNVKNKDINVKCAMYTSKMEHCAKLIGTRINFTNSERPHDVVLVVENKKFHVLKQYLATWSKYFNELFFGDSANEEKKQFKIDDVDAKEFIVLLHIIYPSVLTKVSDNNVLYLLKLAARFEMPSVVSMCGTYLTDFEKLKTLGLMERLVLSDKHNISHLQVACLKKLHAMTAVEQQAFRDKNREQIKDLSEETVKNMV